MFSNEPHSSELCCYSSGMSCDSTKPRDQHWGSELRWQSQWKSSSRNFFLTSLGLHVSPHGARCASGASAVSRSGCSIRGSRTAAVARTVQVGHLRCWIMWPSVWSLSKLFHACVFLFSRVLNWVCELLHLSGALKVSQS